MSSFGVTPEGFNIKPIEIILDEMVQDERAAFGPELVTEADSVAGQLNGVVADKVAELWEVLAETQKSFQPDFATGEALDQLAGLTGTVRLGQLPSKADIQLNLDAGTTVTTGQIIGIGAAGEQWTIDTNVTNAGASQTTVAATATSVNLGEIIGNPGTIDTIVTPILGWTAQAAISSLNTEPYLLVDGQTLLVSVDGGAAQTATFNTADFASIGAATAAEVAAVISTDITGAGAIDATGLVRIISDLNGSGSSIKVTGGTAQDSLGFTRARFIGFNPDRPATVTNGNVEPYALVDGQSISIKVDGGSAQTAVFNTGDFVDINNATALEVARVINTDVTGSFAVVANTRVYIESLVVGVNSQIEVTGGTANGALNFIEAAVNGVSGAATLGREIELDPALRIRREQLLRVSGKATLEAIRAAALSVDLVQQAFVFENVTLVTNVNGLPGKSFEVVAFGGDDTEIAQSIFDTKPVGILSHRDPGPDGRTVAITDSQGISHDINFSRPGEIQMYIETDIEVNGAEFGGGDINAGVQQVKDALKDLGDSLQIGGDVIILRFACAPLTITGVVDVTLMQIEDIFPPVNTSNIVIADRDIATFSVTDMVINVTVV